MRSAPRLVALALLGTLLAGCLSVPPHVVDWQEEAAAHGPMGQAAELYLSAETFVLVGKGNLTAATAPFIAENMARSTRTAPMTFFHGTLHGVGTGLIVVTGDRIEIVSGEVHDLPVDRLTRDPDGIRAAPEPSRPDVPPISFPDEMSDIESNWFFAKKTAVELRALVIQEADEVLLFVDGAVIEPEPPLHLDADLIGLERRSTLLFPGVQVSYDRFAYGGDGPSGTVRSLDGETHHDPVGVFGDNATFRIEADRVASTAPFRLTQVLSATGTYSVPAQVELQATHSEFSIDAGNTSWARIDLREKGYLGSAVLDDLVVTGAAAHLIRVPLDRPPWLIEELWTATSETGLAPFVALPVAIASPFILAGEALLKGFDCVLADCPTERPYPAWIEPGAIGRFYIQVDATAAAPGTYEGTLRVLGANHEPVELPLRIHVQ